MTDPESAWVGLRGQILAVREMIPNALPRGSYRSRMSRLDGLLADCRTRLAPELARQDLKLRSLHHFACTGGTLIARCLGAQPNTRLLSEVDPLSPQRNPRLFHPTDLGFLARLGTRPADEEALIKVFLEGLRTLLQDSDQSGRDLVLRDHAHGKYCHGAQVQSRPGLHSILSSAFPLRAMVSVRHPLDSYLSLERNGWVHFRPGTLADYAKRMMRFLDDHDGIEQLRYEDVLADPQARIATACSILELPFDPDFADRIDKIRLSGDSGRTGAAIDQRPRRPVSKKIRRQASRSATYEALCARLAYDPDPDHPPV